MSKTLQIAIASILSGGLLVGCGEGDAGGSGVSPTLAVTSSTPANRATGVAVDQPFSIEFAENVLAASLDGNIVLMPGASGMEGMENMNMGPNDVMDHSGMDMSAMASIPGTATCDPIGAADCKKIKFTPLMSLEWGQKYHVMVHNLKTKSGKTFNLPHLLPLEFTTAFVVETKSEQNLPVGSPNYRKTETTYQDNGTGQRPTRLTRVVTSGTQSTVTLYNQTLGDRTGVEVRLNQGQLTLPSSNQMDDIVVSRYTLPVRDTKGKLAASITYKGRGLDNRWGTADDLASSFTLRNEDHLTHRLTSSFKATAAAGTAISAATVAQLLLEKTKPAAWESSGASLGFFEIQATRPRLIKEIRFATLGANKELNIDINGNKEAGSDDVINEYRVYQYNQHGVRSARKEYENAAGLTLNETSDAASLSGYRVYKTANDQLAFGNATGMLRVAEITYSGVTAQNITNEDSLAVKDYEMNFYCRPNVLDGAYEKYEIEVKPNGTTLGGNNTNTTFPNAQVEAYLAPNGTNCNTVPNASYLSGMGLLGAIQDIAENMRY